MSETRPRCQQASIRPGGILASLWAILSILALLLLTGCNEGQRGTRSGDASGPATAGRTIEGQAYLAEADPVTSHSGILVYLGGTGCQARTDSGGNYRITGVPGGAYELIAEKTGYRTVTFDTIAVDPGSEGTPLRPKIPFLQKAETTTTATLDPAARPLGSITGMAMLQGTGDFSGIRVQLDNTGVVTVTDEEGRYRLTNVDAGTYAIHFSAPGYRNHTIREVVVRAGEEARVLDGALEALPPGATPVPPPVPTPAIAATPIPPGTERSITGIVTVPTIEGAAPADLTRVMVAIIDTDLIASPDAQGRFRFGSLTPGVYTVMATLDGVGTTRQAVDLNAQVSASLNLTITGTDSQAPGTITGRFVLSTPDGGSQPDASGVRVGLVGTQSTAISAANGTFTLRDVPAGTYTLNASKDEYEEFTQDGVQVTAGQTVDLGDLVMEPNLDYPRVIGTTPANGTTNVPVELDMVIQVRFSKKMNVASVRQALSIDPPVAAQILMGKGVHPLADDDNLVLVLSNLDAQVPIKFKTSYRLRIARTATDTDGLGMREDFSMSFGTGAAGVIATQPANGARDVYLDQNQVPVILNFTTRLDPGTINSRSIRVKPDNGISVSVTSTNDPRTGWSNVQVSTQWQQDTQYTITVGREVRAFNGQVLGNTPYVLRFRTGVLRVLQGPIQVIR